MVRKAVLLMVLITFIQRADAYIVSRKLFLSILIYSRNGNLYSVIALHCNRYVYR